MSESMMEKSLPIIFAVVAVAILLWVIVKTMSPPEQMEKMEDVKEESQEYVESGIAEPVMTQSEYLPLQQEEPVSLESLLPEVEKKKLSQKSLSRYSLKRLQSKPAKGEHGMLPEYSDADKMMEVAVPTPAFENKSFLPYEDSVLTNRMTKVQNYSIMASPEMVEKQDFGILKTSYAEMDRVGLDFQ
jgi:hypothetical protein